MRCCYPTEEREAVGKAEPVAVVAETWRVRWRRRGREGLSALLVGTSRW